MQSYIKKMISVYYKILDETIIDSTLIVVFIWWMIFITWYLNQINIWNLNTSVLNYNTKKLLKKDTININYQTNIIIDWKKYKLTLEKIID